LFCTFRIKTVWRLSAAFCCFLHYVDKNRKIVDSVLKLLGKRDNRHKSKYVNHSTTEALLFVASRLSQRHNILSSEQSIHAVDIIRWNVSGADSSTAKSRDTPGNNTWPRRRHCRDAAAAAGLEAVSAARPRLVLAAECMAVDNIPAVDTAVGTAAEEEDIVAEAGTARIQAEEVDTVRLGVHLAAVVVAPGSTGSTFLSRYISAARRSLLTIFGLFPKLY
jgi:hypothetical protein